MAITPQRMSLTAKTYKSPSSSQSSQDSQSKSKSPHTSSPLKNMMSSPQPSDPTKTPPRTVSPEHGSKRVGRRKSLEAKNKPREEPISPSMPIPTNLPDASSDLPATEIEKLKKEFEDIDSFALKEEIVHTVPKINKYDVGENEAAIIRTVVNKTPKQNAKPANKQKAHSDGPYSPYSSPRGISPPYFISFIHFRYFLP